MHDADTGHPSSNDTALRAYQVTWSIDVVASSPGEAARQALAAMPLPVIPVATFQVAWTQTFDDSQFAAEATTRLHLDLTRGAPSTSGRTQPELSIDVDRAAAWLLEPAQEDPTRTNIQCYGLIDDLPSSIGETDFFGSINVLLVAASRAHLFGPLVSMRIVFSTDDDGSMDAAMLITTLQPFDQRSQVIHIGTGPLHREHLRWHPKYPVALGTLHAIAALANASLAASRTYLTHPDAEADLARPAGDIPDPDGAP